MTWQTVNIVLFYMVTVQINVKSNVVTLFYSTSIRLACRQRVSHVTFRQDKTCLVRQSSIVTTVHY